MTRFLDWTTKSTFSFPPNVLTTDNVFYRLLLLFPFQNRWKSRGTDTKKTAVSLWQWWESTVAGAVWQPWFQQRGLQRRVLVMSAYASDLHGLRTVETRLCRVSLLINDTKMKWRTGSWFLQRTLTRPAVAWHRWAPGHELEPGRGLQGRQHWWMPAGRSGQWKRHPQSGQRKHYSEITITSALWLWTKNLFISVTSSTTLPGVFLVNGWERIFFSTPLAEDTG